MRRLLLAAALCLAGCATPPAPPPPPQGWSGKLGYRIEASSSQRPQAGSARFEWQGDAQTGSLALSSPLGTLLAQANWDADGVRLADEKGQQRRFADLADLGAALGQALQGPSLPVQALFDWLQGRPDPRLAHEPHPEGGFVQLGWRVERPDAQRLVISRPAEGSSGAMSLRLILGSKP